MGVLHVTKENFEAEVMNSDKPILIDFWASWCGPCKMQSPIIDEIGEEITYAKICKVNVDEQPQLASQFKIMTIPTLVVIKDGKIMSSASGVKQKEAVIDMLNV